MAAIAVLAAGLLPAMPVEAATPAGPLPPVLTPKIDPSAAVGSLGSSTLATGGASSSGATPALDAAPTEVPSLRTAYSNTYDNHDGTFTASVSPSVINYRPTPNSDWTPIDLTLAPIGGGNGRVRASQTPSPVEVGAPDDSSGFVSVDTGAGKIRLRLAPGAKPGHAGSKPTVANGHADVSGLLAGVDLRVIPNADGFRLFLILASSPTSNSFTFALDSGSLTPTLQADGSISFADKAGTVVATMPAPYATDSTADDRRGGGLYTDKVSYALSKSGGQNLLTVSVDPTWLASATYPVYVDPSLTLTGPGPTYNTFVSHYYPTSNFNGYYNGTYYEMWLGTDPTNSSNYNYALVKFALPSAITSGGVTINSATLGVYPYWQYQHSGGVTTWIDRITSNWDVHTVTWNNQPSSTGSPWL